MYELETLTEDEDDGTMPDSLHRLTNAVVGRRIASVDVHPPDDWYAGSEMVATLDDGTRVRVRGSGDCCAYTEVESFLLHPDSVDHIITGVGTTDGYTTWHIYADMGDILKLNVEWSCGNPFYYAYGFHIQVESEAE